MARQARLVVPGYPHHLLQRGNNRQAIFLDDDDRRRYLAMLNEAAREHRVAIHAYVLMGNHVHLLGTPEQTDSLSRCMQSLGRRYVGWFNHRHQRTGTLWEGRFKTHLIEAEPYLLACQRYIELNPHRAGLASDLLDYRWSSLPHHLGTLNDPLVSEHPVFWTLGNTPFEREATYRQWLQEGIAEAESKRMTEALLKGQVLASPNTLRQLELSTRRALTAPRPRGRPVKVRTMADSVPNKSP
jgi:putative transposase